jgi:hypothetical protein
MPKHGQYKVREEKLIDPNEKFNYKFEVSTPHNEEFSRWLYYELVNTCQWNPRLIKETTMGEEFRYPDYWRITISPHTKRITIECNARVFSIRKGLKVNATREAIIIE